MPQLDKITYISQLFWLLLTITILYFVILKWILPVIATSLKLRKKIIDGLLTDNVAINKETFNTIKQQNELISFVTKPILNSINNIKNECIKNETIQNINFLQGKEFKEINNIIETKMVSIYITNILVEKE